MRHHKKKNSTTNRNNGKKQNPCGGHKCILFKKQIFRTTNIQDQTRNFTQEIKKQKTKNNPTKLRKKLKIYKGKNQVTCKEKPMRLKFVFFSFGHSENQKDLGRYFTKSETSQVLT